MARHQAFLDMLFFLFSTSSNFYENDLNLVYCGEYSSRMTPRFIHKVLLRLRLRISFY